MVADVDNLGALSGSDLVAALAGDLAAVNRVRAHASEVSEAQPDYEPVDSEFLVLDADASQSFIVNASTSGRNLVVQGPPGTGKSQTIANVSRLQLLRAVLSYLLRRSARQSRRFLNRLERVGLEPQLELDMFAPAGSRRYVADELREASIPEGCGGFRWLTTFIFASRKPATDWCGTTMRLRKSAAGDSRRKEAVSPSPSSAR